MGANARPDGRAPTHKAPRAQEAHAGSILIFGFGLWVPERKKPPLGVGLTGAETTMSHARPTPSRMRVR